MSFVAKAQELGATVIHAQTVSGSEWTDESGNGHHGTAVGAVRSASGGPSSQLDGYWSTDGVDDYIEIVDHADLRATSHSMVMFVRRDANSQNSFSISHVAKGADNDAWMWRQEGATLGEIRLTIGGNHYSSGLGAYPADAWYCFLLQFEPGRVDGPDAEVFRIDPDGTRTRVQDRTTVPTPVPDNGLNLSYAARHNGTGYESFYRADYAAVAQFHGTYLTKTQFQELYDAAFSEVGGYTYLPPALTVTLQDPTTKSLSWTDQSADKYIIERNSSPDGSVWTFDKFVEEAGLTLLDTIVDDGTQYRYRIKSVKAV